MLDTNVIMSAALLPGSVPRRAFDKALDEGVILISEAVLRALAAGETDVEKMGELARRRMKRKKPELKRALAGRLTAAQRWVLTELLDQYEGVEAAVKRVEEKIGVEVEQSPDPFVPAAVALLDTIPGIAERVAETIVSEIGVEMKQFPTDGHLAS